MKWNITTYPFFTENQRDHAAASLSACISGQRGVLPVWMVLGANRWFLLLLILHFSDFYLRASVDFLYDGLMHSDVLIRPSELSYSVHFLLRLFPDGALVIFRGGKCDWKQIVGYDDQLLWLERHLDSCWYRGCINEDIEGFTPISG